MITENSEWLAITKRFKKTTLVHPDNMDATLIFLWAGLIGSVIGCVWAVSALLGCYL